MPDQVVESSQPQEISDQRGAGFFALNGGNVNQSTWLSALKRAYCVDGCLKEKVLRAYLDTAPVDSTTYYLLSAPIDVCLYYVHMHAVSPDPSLHPSNPLQLWRNDQ